MNYGMNQAGFPSDDFSRCCEILASAGYDGIEPNYSEDGLLTTDRGRQVAKQAIEDHDLAVPAISSTMHWEHPLSSADDERRARGNEIGKEMVDIAALLNADKILIVPAFVTAGDDYDSAYENAVSSVRALARYAEKQDVTIAVENVQNNFLYSPNEYKEFLADVGDVGSVSIYLDVGNSFRWGLPERWIRDLGDHISRVHVKDWIDSEHRPTYPLQGDINWESVTSALADIEYNGWITAEIPPYTSHPERTPRQLLANLQFLFEESPASLSQSGGQNS